jgi:hypothetical protein
MGRWNKVPFEPYGSKKDINCVFLFMDPRLSARAIDYFCVEVSAAYEVGN